MEKDIPFHFHQTGAYFIKDGRMYRVKRGYQLSQARKAGIDYRIGEYFLPEKIAHRLDPCPGQMKLEL